MWTFQPDEWEWDADGVTVRLNDEATARLKAEGVALEDEPPIHWTWHDDGSIDVELLPGALH